MPEAATDRFKFRPKLPPSSRNRWQVDHHAGMSINTSAACTFKCFMHFDSTPTRAAHALFVWGHETADVNHNFRTAREYWLHFLTTETRNRRECEGFPGIVLEFSAKIWSLFWFFCACWVSKFAVNFSLGLIWDFAVYLKKVWKCLVYSLPTEKSGFRYFLNVLFYLN